MNIKRKASPVAKFFSSVKPSRTVGITRQQYESISLRSAVTAMHTEILDFAPTERDYVRLLDEMAISPNADTKDNRGYASNFIKKLCALHDYNYSIGLNPLTRGLSLFNTLENGAIDLHFCSFGAVYYWLLNKIEMLQLSAKNDIALTLIPGKGNHSNNLIDGLPPLQAAIRRVVKLLGNNQVTLEVNKNNAGVFGLTIYPKCEPKVANSSVAETADTAAYVSSNEEDLSISDSIASMATH